jgi:hypothetical protein
MPILGQYGRTSPKSWQDRKLPVFSLQKVSHLGLSHGTWTGAQRKVTLSRRRTRRPAVTRCVGYLSPGVGRSASHPTPSIGSGTGQSLAVSAAPASNKAVRPAPDSQCEPEATTGSPSAPQRSGRGRRASWGGQPRVQPIRVSGYVRAFTPGTIGCLAICALPSTKFHHRRARSRRTRSPGDSADRPSRYARTASGRRLRPPRRAWRRGRRGLRSQCERRPDGGNR